MAVIPRMRGIEHAEFQTSDDLQLAKLGAGEIFITSCNYKSAEKANP